MLGCVAVKSADNDRVIHRPEQRLVDSLMLAQVARRARIECLRLASFPLNLIPSAPRSHSPPNDLNRKASITRPNINQNGTAT
jgi:hypothetical protein